MSASPVPPTELSPEMEATLGIEARLEPMLVVVRQEKLLEKLNLDGLAHWSPKNAEVAKELVLACHDVFALESNELGCSSAIEHEICIENSEPFKEWFQCIPPPLFEEVCASLQDMLEVGSIHPSQSPWCNAVVLVRKKDGTLHFCVDFRHLNVHQRRICTLCPTFRKHWKAWQGQRTSRQWTSSHASGKSRWLLSHNNTQPLQWVTSDSMSSHTCRLGCVMPR